MVSIAPVASGAELRPIAGSTETLGVDPDELSTRYMLASSIRRAGESDLAAAGDRKDPGSRSRTTSPRAWREPVEAIEPGDSTRPSATLNAVLNHPDLIEYLRKDPTLLRCFHQVSRKLSIGGKAQEGQVLGKEDARPGNRASSAPERVALQPGTSLRHARSKRSPVVAQAADELWWVFVANPANQVRYLQDIAFDPVREQIDAVLRRKGDPTAEHERLVTTPLARAH